MAFTIKIYYQNVNGIRSKTNDFFISVCELDYDVIMLTETFLNDSVFNSEIFDLNKYNVFRRDRVYSSVHEKGGGVLIAVKKCNKIKSAVRCTDLESTAEDIFVKININKQIIFLCCAYLVHSLNIDVFEDHLNKLDSVCARFPTSEIVVIGDYNLPNFINSSGDIINYDLKSDKLINCLNFCDLKQLSSIFNYSGVMLDLVLSNKILNISEAQTDELLTNIDPHHPAIIVEFDGHNNIRERISCESLFNFWKADYTVINDFLFDINWDEEIFNLEFQLMLDGFYNKIYEVFNFFVPVKTKNNSRFPPWYTMPLIKLYKEKKKFFDKWKVYKNIRDYDTYCLLRRRFKKMIGACYSNYLKLTEKSIGDDSREFWNYVKNKRKNSDGLPNSFYLDDKVGETSKENVDLFAEYFQSVYENVDGGYQPEVGDFYSAINISSITISPATVFCYLNKLDEKKSGGPDLVPAVFLHRCAAALAYPLSLLFTKSLEEGVFPAIWKKSFITPVFKSGSKSDVKNYRPICKLSCIPKLLESIITDILTKTFKSVIISQQHGFMKGKSAATNLVSFAQFIHEQIDEHHQVDAIYTDFQKAFDKVDHCILFNKLQSSGIHGDLLRWIISYIENRVQLVKIKGEISKNIYVTSGVPQGSHLGPLLFLLYVNDINDCLKRSKFLLFADDCKLFIKVTSLSDCCILQSELNKFSEYCDRNKLKLNINKCHVISFTKNKVNKIIFDYKINNRLLDRVQNIVDLGVTFDVKLKLDIHFTNIVKRAYRMLGFLLRICYKFKSIAPFITIYKSLVRSQLEYCSIIWNPTYNTYVAQIESIQKKFCHFIFYKNLLNLPDNFIYHYIDMLKLINLDSLASRRMQFDLLFTFKSMNGLNSADGYIHHYNFELPSRTRSHHTFALNTSNTNIGLNSPFNRLMSSFNIYCDNLDLNLISLSSFKTKIKENIRS